MILARRLVPVAPLALLVALGCSDRNPHAPATVSGTVTYKGEAVGGGRISFHTRGAGVYSAALRSDGRYQCRDLPTGDMVVTIETESVNPDLKVPDYKGGSGPQLAGKKSGARKAPAPTPGGGRQVGRGKGVKMTRTEGNTDLEGKYVQVPARYADKGKSKLTTTLSPGEQTRDFALTE